MCECGCVGNDDRYTLKGPNKSLYIIHLHGGCTNCDSSPGLMIEHVLKTDVMYNEFRNGEFIDGELPFINGADRKFCPITTGFRKHEFIKKMTDWLVGIDSEELGDEGVVDEAGAEVILEEMYEDSLVKPTVIEEKK